MCKIQSLELYVFSFILFIFNQLYCTRCITWKVSKYRVISGPYFTEYGLKIQSECVNIRTRNYSVFGLFSRSVALIQCLITAQTMKFLIKDFFNKCDQIRRKLQFWSHLQKKFFTENFIFYAVHLISRVPSHLYPVNLYIFNPIFFLFSPILHIFCLILYVFNLILYLFNQLIHIQSHLKCI